MNSREHQQLLQYFYPSYAVAVAVYTFVGMFVFDFAIDVPFDLSAMVAPSTVLKAIGLILLSAIAYSVGWHLSAWLLRGRWRREEWPSFQLGLSKSKRIFIGLSGLLLFLLYLYGYGVENILERSSYMGYLGEATPDALILKLHMIGLPFVAIGIAFLKSRAARHFLLLINALVLLAASTRLLGLVVFLYGLGRLINNGFRLNMRICIILLVAVYGFVWIFEIRDSAPQGLVPNLKSLLDANTIGRLANGLNYILSFSTYVLSYSLEYKSFDLSSFGVSLSPLPLRFYDAEALLEAQTLIYGVPAPMSAIAILYSAGIPMASCFYFFLGCYCNYIGYTLRKRPLIYYLVVVILIVTVLFSFQYNLRGMMRLIYLSLAITVAFRYLSRLEFKKRL